MSNPSPQEIEQMSDLLRSGAAFEGMPASVANRVVALMQLRSVAAGELLTQEGVGNSGQLILVVSGEAEISSRSIQDGGHLVHRVAKPGHIIGEVGFIDNQAHSACESLYAGARPATFKITNRVVDSAQTPAAALALNYSS